MLHRESEVVQLQPETERETNETNRVGRMKRIICERVTVLLLQTRFSGSFCMLLFGQIRRVITI